MPNGFWTIKILTPDEPREIVTVFSEGMILGVSPNYLFEGDYYTIGQGRIVGKIVARHYKGETDQLFNGAGEISIAIDAQVLTNKAMQGMATEVGSLMTFPLHGVKRA